MGRFLFGLMAYGPVFLFVALPFIFMLVSCAGDSFRKPKEAYQIKSRVSRRTKAAILTPICLILLIVLSPQAKVQFQFGFELKYGWLLSLCALFGPQLVYWNWTPHKNNTLSLQRIWLLIILVLAIAGWFYHTAWLLF